MLSSTISGKRRDRLRGLVSRGRGRHGLRGRACRASAAPLADARAFARPPPPSGPRPSASHQAPVWISITGAPTAAAASICARLGGDEQRDADAGVAAAARRAGASALRWPATSSPPSVVRSSRRSGTRQAACGRSRARSRTISSVAAISRLSGLVDLGLRGARCRRRGCGGDPRADAR